MARLYTQVTGFGIHNEEDRLALSEVTGQPVKKSRHSQTWTSCGNNTQQKALCNEIDVAGETPDFEANMQPKKPQGGPKLQH